MGSQHHFSRSHILVVLGSVLLELRQREGFMDRGVQRRVLHQTVYLPEHLEHTHQALLLDVGAEDEGAEDVAATNHEEWIDAFQGLFGQATVESHLTFGWQAFHQFGREGTAYAFYAGRRLEFRCQLLDVIKEGLRRRVEHVLGTVLLLQQLDLLVAANHINKRDILHGAQLNDHATALAGSSSLNGCSRFVVLDSLDQAACC